MKQLGRGRKVAMRCLPVHTTWPQQQIGMYSTYVLYLCPSSACADSSSLIDVLVLENVHLSRSNRGQ